MDHDGHGARVRDERRYRLLGDSYYCINHPPHYREMERKLQKEYDALERQKMKAKRASTKDELILSGSRREPDPVLSLGSVETIPPLQLKLMHSSRQSRFVNLHDFDYSQLTSLPRAPSIDSLYKQAAVILRDILPPARSTEANRLPRFYGQRNLNSLNLPSGAE
ncbi:unnamed protein product [Dicrocoelium dendriticum]|nr:unnamed protein product [Dicrocoelium dendriticum]